MIDAWTTYNNIDVRCCPFCGNLDSLSVREETATNEAGNSVVETAVACTVCGARGPVQFYEKNIEKDQVDVRSLAALVEWNVRGDEDE